MLKWRILTAALLIPLLVYGVLNLSTSRLGWVFAVVIAIGAAEWSRMVPLHSIVARSVFIALVTGAVIVAKNYLDAGAFDWRYLLPAACVWIGISVWLPMANPVNHGSAVSAVLKFLAGLLILVSAWCAVMYLHRLGSYGPGLTLGLLVMIWAADSGAYFSGKRWGHRKLAPSISPGKTWEGFIGGMVLSLPVILATGWLAGWRDSLLAGFALVAMAAVMISVVGDLFISLLKRQRGIKDSGHILPGHGGMLDRIDSTLSASPLLVVGIAIAGLLPVPGAIK